MDHQVALSSQAVERYTLGELTSPQREAFEEHFFSCSECAEALREYEVFVANTRAVLQEEGEPIEVPTRAVSWWEGFRKWFAVPAVAFAGLALAVVLLRDGTAVPPANGPRVEWDLKADTRAGEAQKEALQSNTDWAELHLKLQMSEPDRWASYHWEVRRVDGNKLIEQGDGRGSGVLTARVPAARFETNKLYQLSVQGVRETDPLISTFAVDRSVHRN